MSKEYSLPLKESEILFFAEIIALAYCSVLKRACVMSIGLEVPILPALMEEMLRKNLRALLREPLRNPLFRERFNEYFRVHDYADIRNVAWVWMQEILVWES